MANGKCFTWNWEIWHSQKMPPYKNDTQRKKCLKVICNGPSEFSKGIIKLILDMIQTHRILKSNF